MKDEKYPKLFSPTPYEPVLAAIPEVDEEEEANNEDEVNSFVPT
ncbi:hypothetical protein [Legionella antarctica]|nr:hypothetical protein [Legionella antarctica]